MALSDDPYEPRVEPVAPVRPRPATHKHGRFITFEGGEGVGKSTQIERLAERLRARGIDVVVTREPGGSPRAEAIRELILSGGAKGLGPDAEAMLFAAARADHVESLIAPALKRGAWVLSDRFADSTRVYQGSSGVDPRLVRALERVAVGDVRPDLTIILDLPADEGLRRAATRRGGDHDADRFEAEDLIVHEARRARFLAIAADEPERCVVVDAAGAPEEVASAIWAVVEERLEPDAVAASDTPTIGPDDRVLGPIGRRSR